MAVDGDSLSALLAGLFPGHAPDLLHLLSCESCRAWATAALIEEHGARIFLPVVAGEEAGASDEPGGLPARAGQFRSEALAQWERGRFDDAESLLGRAASLYGDARQLGEEGATLTLLGVLRLEAGPPYARAAAALFPGLPALTGRRRWLAARGTLALALALASLGRPREAEDLLEQARDVVSGVVDPDELVRLSWLEGRARGRVGQLDRAESLLSAVRRQLLQEGSLAEGVLASFDLGVVLAEAGDFARIRSMAAELGRLTAGRRILSRACRELRDFRWEEPESRRDRVELTALPHRKHFRRRSLGLRPLPLA